MGRVGKSIVYRVAIHNTFVPSDTLPLITYPNSLSELLRYKIFADIAPDLIREHMGKGRRKRNCLRRALIPEGTAWAEPRQTPSIGRFLFFFKGRFWPTLLKKSGMVCASEKYASEIQISTCGRGFRTRISRSSVEKRRFHQSMMRQLRQTDFFNRIGRKQSLRGC
jgi:hypothetical protein